MERCVFETDEQWSHVASCCAGTRTEQQTQEWPRERWVVVEGTGCSADGQGGGCTPVCTPTNDEHHTRGVTSKSTQTKRTCAFWGGCLCLRVRRLICTTTRSAVSPKAESVHKERRTYGEACASSETQRVVVVGQQRVAQTGPPADTGAEGRSRTQ
jgi:hypothetical protein